MTLRKGAVIDNLTVSDTLTSTFALYLPTTFSSENPTPIVFVVDPQQRGKQALSLFLEAAEKYNFAIAAPNSISADTTLEENTRNFLVTFQRVSELLRLDSNHIYIAGHQQGGDVALVAPAFIKGINGLIISGTSMNPTQLMNMKNQFFGVISIIGIEDYRMIDLWSTRPWLTNLKKFNELYLVQEGSSWPLPQYLTKAMRSFQLQNVLKAKMPRVDSKLTEMYADDMAFGAELEAKGHYAQAMELYESMESDYKPLVDISSLKEHIKELKRNSTYKAQAATRTKAIQEEIYKRDEFMAFIEEDISSKNLSNLGWWYDTLDLLKKDEPNQEMAFMNKRLLAFVDALISDHLKKLVNEPKDDSHIFLWVLQIMLNEKRYESYKNIISLSAENSDYGTAYYYLEEMLKNGYKDEQGVYSIEHTAILRITPEFNELVKKYLGTSRY